MVQITSVLKSHRNYQYIQSIVYYQCIQSCINLPVHSQVYKIPVHSKELYHLPVVLGMVYEITKYKHMGHILL